MIKLDIVIGDCLDNEKCLYYQGDNIIRLSFKNEDDYLNFSKNPHIKIEDFDPLSLEYNIDKLLSNIDFPKLFNESIPRFDITKISDLPIKFLSTKKKGYLNIIELPLKDRLSIINHPLVHENISIYDTYSNGKELSKDMLRKMYTYLFSIANNIKLMNYSQVEIIYSIYNLLKEKIYKEDNNDLDNSRCLYNVLWGDAIVCTGYANFFLSLCEILGIKAEKTGWSPSNSKEMGHDAIMVYINDSKYKIVGIYGIDVTWDAKKNIEDTSYKNNIENFLVPALMEEKIKSINGLNPSIGSDYYGFFKSYYLFKRFPFIDTNGKVVTRKVNKIYDYLRIEMPNNLDIAYKELLLLGHQTIDADTLKDIIQSVTPKNEEDINATLRTCVYEQNIINILKRILKK